MRSTRIVRLCTTALFAVALWSQPLALYTEISPPDQFLGPEGRLSGYAVEVVAEIQKRIGDDTPIQVVPWVRGYNEVLGPTQAALFSTVRSRERDPLLQWVGPLRDITYWFYVRKGAQIQIRNLGDAKRLPLVGVYKEDVRDQFLTRMGFQNLDRSLDLSLIHISEPTRPY